MTRSSTGRQPLSGPPRAPGLVERITGWISTSLRLPPRRGARLAGPASAGSTRGRTGMRLGTVGRTAAGARRAELSRHRHRRGGHRPGSGTPGRSPVAERMAFDVAAVRDLGSQGDALVFSLGLFDWLMPTRSPMSSPSAAPATISMRWRKDASAQQLIHRAYVYFSYGRRTGYRARLPPVAEIDALAGNGRLGAGQGLSVMPACASGFSSAICFKATSDRIGSLAPFGTERDPSASLGNPVIPSACEGSPLVQRDRSAPSGHSG